MKVLITNTDGRNALSLDVTVGRTTIREKIPAGGYVDVGDQIEPEMLNMSGIIRQLVSNGKITISTVSEADDVESLVDQQLMQNVQAVAATQTTTLIGAADFTGVIQVEAQVGAIPATGESMVFDVLKNGTTILASALVANPTTSPVARRVLYGNEGGATVVKGDEISVARTYTAGGGPTPIINSVITVKILKAP